MLWLLCHSASFLHMVLTLFTEWNFSPASRRSHDLFPVQVFRNVPFRLWFVTNKYLDGSHCIHSWCVFSLFGWAHSAFGERPLWAVRTETGRGRRVMPDSALPPWPTTEMGFPSLEPPPGWLTEPSVDLLTQCKPLHTVWSQVSFLLLD